ncbi:hypothetical protein FAI41_04220 [Acetobacteraceae bacterium]|nr:hypothetical protein FAI41_04220 [Acetobacteraceae bacterium]
MKHRPNRHTRRRAKALQEPLGLKVISFPPHLCLEEKPDISRRFFWQLRETINAQEPMEFFLELGTLQQIGFATAIALTAEFQRLNEIRGKRFRLPSLKEKHYSQAIHMLHSIGFFKHITLNPEKIPWLERHFLPIQSGDKAIPDLIETLQTKLLHLSKKNWNTRAFNLPLIESIANTVEHAYPVLSSKKFPEFKIFKEKRWWVCMQLDESQNEIELVCVDLGITIPKSIEFFHRDIPPADSIDDIHRLFWACSPNKSGTNKSYRGKGLSEIIAPIQENNENTVTIISGYAEANFSLQRKANGEGNNFSFPYSGTLIKWHIKLSPLS